MSKLTRAALPNISGRDEEQIVHVAQENARRTGKPQVVYSCNNYTYVAFEEVHNFDTDWFLERLFGKQNVQFVRQVCKVTKKGTLVPVMEHA